MNKQIGWYDLKEDKEFQNHFECAAWYENIAVKAGKYPINVVDFRTRENPEGTEVEGHINSVYITFPGKIISDYFGSLFYGVPTGTYDNKKNAGKDSRHISQHYMFSVADSVLNDPNTPYELFPEYEAREIHFVYKGEKHITHGIFVKEGVKA